MGLITETVSWAHFITFLRETVEEIKKTLSAHSSQISLLGRQDIETMTLLTRHDDRHKRLAESVAPHSDQISRVREKSLILEERCRYLEERVRRLEVAQGARTNVAAMTIESIASPTPLLPGSSIPPSDP